MIYLFQSGEKTDIRVRYYYYIIVVNVVVVLSVTCYCGKTGL